MTEDIRRAKTLLESKGYVVTKGLVFEGLDDNDVVPLNEFLDVHGNECSWEMSLEESLETQEFSGNQTVEYKVGDIIMPKSIHSKASGFDIDPHRILLIYSKKEESGLINYKGFLLSSKIDKSNKKNPKYPNNIYIEDYSTILYKGAMEHKSAFIRVDDIIEFTNKDLDVRGTWKGSASNKFFRFVNNCYTNYKNGISNAHRYWTSERRNYGTDSQETA